MIRSTVNGLAATVLLVVCGPAWTDCGVSALDGDWTVFYRDNAFPTSVLAPEATVGIRHDAKTGAVAVAVSDPEWQGLPRTWEVACVDGQAILLGAIQRRGAATTLLIEISRVVKAADLLRNAAGVVRERQIDIRFPQPFAAAANRDALSALAERGALASHPGHAHAWD